VEELARSREHDRRFAASRAMLREIFRETLDAVDVRRVFAAAVKLESDSLRIADLQYALAAFRRVLVVAIGKAAVPSAEDVLNHLAQSNVAVHAVVVGPGELSSTTCGVEHWQGSHPVPDATAREAAVRVIELLRQTDECDLVLFLISGGASAMLEAPLDPAITIGDVAEFYRPLVHSGLSITEMNTLRKHASAVKGGRLAELAPKATKCTLLVSDVPDGSIDVIGSGPTLPDSSTREQCWKLLRRPGLASRFPERIRTFLESPALQETPKLDAPCFEHTEARVLLSTKTMLAAAAESYRRRGFHVVIDNTCDDWEYRAAAEYLLSVLRRVSSEHARVCLLSGGEVLVKLEESAGTGGRNQQFALYCATQLNSGDSQITVLSAGTDGVDGNSPAAGAVVDRTTVERAREAGFEVEDALATFNAYPLLAHIGDAIVTGPTGNNVRDLRILISERI
jgi:hydroxypyruvate reductase